MMVVFLTIMMMVVLEMMKTKQIQFVFQSMFVYHVQFDDDPIHSYVANHGRTNFGTFPKKKLLQDLSVLVIHTNIHLPLG